MGYKARTTVLKLPTKVLIVEYCKQGYSVVYCMRALKIYVHCLSRTRLCYLVQQELPIK